MPSRDISPGNHLRRIDSVWMAVSVDADGTEGICAILRQGAWRPLLAADAERLPFIMQQAEAIAKEQRRLVRIVRLTAREEHAAFDCRN
jgi:hypothetical protein